MTQFTETSFKAIAENPEVKALADKFRKEQRVYSLFKAQLKCQKMSLNKLAAELMELTQKIQSNDIA